MEEIMKALIEKGASEEELIKAYLDEMAKTDTTIAANLLKPNKSMENCIKYVRGEAQKQAKDNCAAIVSDVVFGWALHYWDEDNLDVDKPKPQPKTTTKPAAKTENKPAKGGAKVVTMKPTTTTTKTADKPQNEAKKPTIVQLDLF